MEPWLNYFPICFHHLTSQQVETFSLGEDFWSGIPLKAWSCKDAVRSGVCWVEWSFCGQFHCLVLTLFFLCVFWVIYRIPSRVEETNDPEQRVSAHLASLGHKILMSFGSSLMQESNQ